MVYASGFGLGLTWLFLTATGLLRKLVEITPKYIVTGIRLALGLALAWKALQLMQPAPLLGALAIVIVLVLRDNRFAPAALVLLAIGLGMVAFQGKLPAFTGFQPTLPPFTLPRLGEVWQAMLLAGFAQIPLTLTNAVIAPAALIREYFPKKEVSEQKLMLNMGVMNIAGSLFAGMPMCHGAGGFAGQYYFGARTGGAPIMEGVIEVGIGLFLSKYIMGIMVNFPMPLVAGMLLLVGIQLCLSAVKLRGWELALALVTAVAGVALNLGFGYIIGVIAAWIYKRFRTAVQDST
jgi:MFS superfamily sulfate permease-like transporter